MSIFKKVLSVGSGKLAQELDKKVELINSKESEIEKYSDDEIKNKFQNLKTEITSDNKFDFEVDAFSLVREASKRTIGQRHYDVQLFGGMVLLRNKIAEMKTGEGKTLVSTLPISFMSLFDQSVHVVTVNDYLSRRDAEWMSPIYNFLGLEVGLIYSNQDYQEKVSEYKKDIVYGTNNEFGFDYLRDNMAQSSDQLTQGNLFYAVIDEVDSILVDEARTPLIISGRVEESTKWYLQFSKLVKQMKKDIHYEVDESKKQIHPTEEGIEFIEGKLGIDNLYENTSTNFIHYLTASLRAKEIYKKDIDYIKSDGQVKIVDEFTGRVLEGRRYSDGLHQAIEAKENVNIQDENQTLASITYQNYFRMYEHLSGMTGTAKTEEEELIQIYNLEVVEIPTNLPVARNDNQDTVYKTKKAKLNAVVDDIKKRHEIGQPVLLGTVSVDSSEEISKELTKNSIKHSVLNAKNHLEEASIIAQAGRLKSVTVATNMAGRGVDIKLGGNSEFMAKNEAEKENKIDDEKYMEGLIEKFDTLINISLEDDLMRRFQGERIQSIMDKLNLPDDEKIEQSMVTKSIERAQAQVESLNFEIRKNVLKFDQVLNQQRDVIYKWRRELLKSDNIENLITDWRDDIFDELQNNVDNYKTQYETLEDYRNFVEDELSLILSDNVKKQILQTIEVNDNLEIISSLKSLYNKNYESDKNNFMNLARMGSLSFIDQSWKNHLSEMDYLRSGIGLRAMGQRDPLVEYQKEGYDLFEELIHNVKLSVVRLLLNFEKVSVENNNLRKEEIKKVNLNNKDKIGRNDPCYCGSGLKYKKCGMLDKCTKNS